MGNPTRFHIINVWNFVNVGIDQTDKAKRYLLLEVGLKVAHASRHSELHWGIWQDIAERTSEVRQPMMVSGVEEDRVYYAYPLSPSLLEILGDHLNSITSLGFKHGQIEALTMQAALPGMN
jgi:hypothetical protein